MTSRDWGGTGPSVPISIDPDRTGVETLIRGSSADGVTIDMRSLADVDTDPGPPGELLATPESKGRYRVGEEIGRGGVGVVHRGWDTQLRRAVAIKALLKAHLGKHQVVRRFLEEARITSRLQHPSIVAIHELGVSPDGRPYFVMRLVDGQTLESILQGRVASAAELPGLLTIFLHICQAVGYAHSQGVIHRDLKPANIIVGKFGVVQVMDWGLGKILGEPDPMEAMEAPQPGDPGDSRDPAPGDSPLARTEFGTVFGTPAYLPPEQARGEIDRLDPRADVFGLGAILCAILTGQPPYTGDDLGAIYAKAVAADLADALTRLDCRQAPPDLVNLAKWCLSPIPSDRPTDAGVVVEVMTAYMEADQRRAEQDLIRFFELSPDLFCIAGPDGYFRRINENFPRLLGYTAEELKSRPFGDFVHPDDRAKTEAETFKLSGGAPSIQFLNRYRHAQGHDVWLEWNAQSVPEERAIYAVARDVTERVAEAKVHRHAEQSRLHLASVVDSAAISIISMTLDGIVQSWNSGAERLFGYRAEEMIGQPFRKLIPPAWEDTEAAVLDRLKHHEQVEHYESIRRRKDGSFVPVSITISPVKDEAGHLIGVSGIARDVSDRKRSEAALLESEARLRAVVENAVEAIVTIDQDGTIESLNRSTETMFGYDATELMGQNVRMLMPPSYRDRHDEGLAAYLHTGMRKVIGRTLELVGRRKDESDFPIELSVGEIRLADRLLFTGLIRDVTAREPRPS